MLVTECLLENSAVPTVCFHTVFSHCLLSFGFSAGSMGIRAQACLTLTKCLQTGCWPMVKLGRCWLAPGLGSHCHWTPIFLALNFPHLDGIMHSFPSTSCIALWVVSLVLLIAAEEFTDRKVISLEWQKGHGDMVFISSVPGHPPSSLMSCSAYLLWSRVAVFYYPLF